MLKLLLNNARVEPLKSNDISMEVSQILKATQKMNGFAKVFEGFSEAL